MSSEEVCSELCKLIKSLVESLRQSYENEIGYLRNVIARNNQQQSPPPKPIIKYEIVSPKPRPKDSDSDEEEEFQNKRLTTTNPYD